MKQTDKKRSPFVMPEGYVEDFTFRMMKRIDAEAQAAIPALSRKPRRGRMMQLYVRYAAGVAAALAFFMVCTRAASDQLAGGSAAAQHAMVNDAKAMAAAHSDAMYDYLMIDGQTVYDYEAYNE